MARPMALRGAMRALATWVILHDLARVFFSLSFASRTSVFRFFFRRDRSSSANLQRCACRLSFELCRARSTVNAVRARVTQASASHALGGPTGAKPLQCDHSTNTLNVVMQQLCDDINYIMMR